MNLPLSFVAPFVMLLASFSQPHFYCWDRQREIISFQLKNEIVSIKIGNIEKIKSMINTPNYCIGVLQVDDEIDRIFVFSKKKKHTLNLDELTGYSLLCVYGDEYLVMEKEDIGDINTDGLWIFRLDSRQMKQFNPGTGNYNIKIVNNNLVGTFQSPGDDGVFRVHDINIPFSKLLSLF